MVQDQQHAHGDIMSQLVNCFKPSTTIMPLAAIWLERSVMARKMDGTPVRTVRLQEGMFIRVVNQRIIDCGEPTHQILGCRGTVSSSVLIFDLRNVETDQPEELKIQG